MPIVYEVARRAGAVEAEQAPDRHPEPSAEPVVQRGVERGAPGGVAFARPAMASSANGIVARRPEPPREEGAAPSSTLSPR